VPAISASLHNFEVVRDEEQDRRGSGYPAGVRRGGQVSRTAGAGQQVSLRAAGTFTRRAARHGGDTHLDKDTLREAIDHWLRTATPAVRRFTPHDLRSTVKSHLRALGVPRDIPEMCLNHKLSGVEGLYDRHTYFEERREALGKWADVMVSIVASIDGVRGG
jgi:integrase